MPRAFISKYQKKTVETIQGAKVAKVEEVLFSPTTGKILAFVLKILDEDHPVTRFKKVEGSDRVVVPFMFFLFSDLRLLVKEDAVVEYLARVAGTGEECGQSSGPD